MKIRGPMILLSVAFATLAASQATALSPFKKAFDQRYVKTSGDDAFKAEFKKLGCNTCHVKKKKKDWVNAYGQELAKLIDGNAKQRLDTAKKSGSDARKGEQEKLIKELEAAFAKCETMKSPEDVTYGELFKSHKLPTTAEAKSLKEASTE